MASNIINPWLINLSIHYIRSHNASHNVISAIQWMHSGSYSPEIPARRGVASLPRTRLTPNHRCPYCGPYKQ